MNVTIRKDNIRVQDKTLEYAEEKLHKLTRYMPNIQSIHLELKRQKRRKGGDQVVAQITVRHDRGAIIRAEERETHSGESSVISAINNTIDTMQRRISRFKGKKRSKRERMNAKYRMTMEEMNLAEDVPEEFAEVIDDMPEEGIDEVARRKGVEVHPMSEIEAIEQMELLGHDFFMFLNAETDSISVMYKRDEGDYGILVPQLK
jgi:putative sigma-54 modulation protein